VSYIELAPGVGPNLRICTSLNWHELDPSGDRTKLFVSLHATRLVIENKSLAAFVDEQTVPAWVQLGADEFPG
jgi:hypothetical protein